MTHLLQLHNVKKYFPISGQLWRSPNSVVRAVDGVNLSIEHGETLGLVGESGCGKSTLSRVCLRLIAATEGEIIYAGQDTSKMDRREFRRKCQMIFQDPISSLNPKMKVLQVVREGLDLHNLCHPKQRTQKVIDLLHCVGLGESFLSRFSHELSGGEVQRVCIARALAVEPEFIIADEPVSALDVSTMVQVLNLFKDLQRQRGVTYLFISHDLSVIEYVSDRIAVMYLGRIVEIARTGDLLKNPSHPYTQALLSSLPGRINEREPVPIEGEPPSSVHIPSGCRFHPRCPYRFDRCSREKPILQEVSPNHWVECHLY